MRDGFKYDNYGKTHMSDYSAIAVWIPMIVGLAPGLVYWFVITGMRNRK